MDNYKQNIFFFWDNETPEIYLNHINNIKNLFPNYNVHLIDDKWVINYYTSRNEQDFCNIYKKITLGAAKADIIRFLVIYEYGGLYLDIMNYPREELNIDDLFSKLENKSTYIAVSGTNIGFTLILSKPKTLLIEKLYDLAKNNLINHYKKESNSEAHINYNLVQLTGPLLFHDVVVNKQFYSWDFYLNCREDSPQNQQYFKKWNCDLIDVEKTFWLYKVGFDNHHGKNMDKHWSKQQLKKKLFY